MSKPTITTEITQYLSELNRKYNEGIATEYTYRDTFTLLLENLTDGLSITNEPKRISCGAPDYIITRKQIPTGYIETKIIGKDLDSKEYQEQFDRYKQSLNNLIITDYITFQLFLNGIEVKTVTIAKIGQNGVEPIKSEFEAFISLINIFVGYKGSTIHTSEDLSKILAPKARLMANIIENTLNSNEEPKNGENSDENSLYGQLEGFREVLIPNISHKEFSDMYAQTIAYGMFAAKLNDQTENVFTRKQASELIPQSNPFLRKFFQYIAGYDLDDRICWVVDDLADLFNYVNINSIIKEFQKTDHDPIIHFYETFLSEYDPALRKNRGVWYTPKPVVQFIVQAVDDILKNDFEISDGLADASKIYRDDFRGLSKEYHRVQILDPATGTGTFLAEVVQNIYKKFTNQQGMWQNYAHEHLLPRINGFEILMVSYAMAHLKMDILLKKTGYKYFADERLPIFLTNSLEQAQKKTDLLFAKWLSDEANDASHIKKEVPVMVVIGNPPYNVSTQNINDWIKELIADYKKGLHETKINLDDDYIKFIRYGQYYVSKNGEGILAYISNNSFIDGITHRQMRKSLLETFDKIYILDLHGSSKKKEKTPDGNKDENVFDIMQGVSINIFVKSKLKYSEKLAEIYHYDLYGKRNTKFDFLLKNTLQTVKWKRIENKAPYFFFVPKSEKFKKEYEKGFSIKELFLISGPGIKTERDAVAIHFTKEKLQKTIDDFLKLDVEKLREKFNLGKDSRDWKIEWAKKDLLINKDNGKIEKIQYRPFDFRYTFYTSTSKGFIGTPGYKIVKHFTKNENIGLIFSRQFGAHKHFICFTTNKPIEISSQPYAPYSVFPLYTYIKNGIADNDSRPYHKKHNLNETIIKQFSKKLGFNFTDEKEKTKNTFAPIDILDYIYAVLHNPTYREKYKEFLKIDFPRVPYPENAEVFWNLVKLGEKLRHLHLLEGVESQQNMANFPIAGSNKIEKVQYTINKVYINDTQYFDNVPAVAWNFYIGGYQPAQKWLKDRKERMLNYDDIKHYQIIILALKKTEEIMKEINSLEVKYL
ncbi:MAG: N-6 DNA methylase [Marinilabiliaceae bacterium]|nr:N-6 DNA methylase [Marinilabiliaceae bacterium]